MWRCQQLLLMTRETLSILGTMVVERAITMEEDAGEEVEADVAAVVAVAVAVAVEDAEDELPC